jgi:energy-coupling factor transporter transmembrane protein EcfT
MPWHSEVYLLSLILAKGGQRFRFFHLSAVIAIVFAIFGVIELFDIAKLRFIRMGNSFQFAMLFAIFGMVSRIYYKMFEEKYEKGK